jgi:hypothetical protein
MRLTLTLRQAFVRSAMNDVPKIDHDELARKLLINAAKMRLPTPVFVMIEDPALRDYVKVEQNYYDGIGYVHTPGFERPNLTVGEQKKLDSLIIDKKAQREVFTDLRDKLTSVASSVNTTKKLAELLPDFAKYLPKEDEKSSQLPAVAGVLTDFMSAGWPKKVLASNATAAA